MFSRWKHGISVTNQKYYHLLLELFFIEPELFILVIQFVTYLNKNSKKEVMNMVAIKIKNMEKPIVASLILSIYYLIKKIPQ